VLSPPFPGSRKQANFWCYCTNTSSFNNKISHVETVAPHEPSQPQSHHNHTSRHHLTLNLNFCCISRWLATTDTVLKRSNHLLIFNATVQQATMQPRGVVRPHVLPKSIVTKFSSYLGFNFSNFLDVFIPQQIFMRLLFSEVSFVLVQLL
jgi:hypothetical protein